MHTTNYYPWWVSEAIDKQCCIKSVPFFRGYDLKTASNGSDFVLHSHFTWEKQLALKVRQDNDFSCNNLL